MAPFIFCHLTLLEEGGDTYDNTVVDKETQRKLFSLVDCVFGNNNKQQNPNTISRFKTGNKSVKIMTR